MEIREERWEEGRRGRDKRGIHSINIGVKSYHSSSALIKYQRIMGNINLQVVNKCPHFKINFIKVTKG
jgi:hypothetical protein